MADTDTVTLEPPSTPESAEAAKTAVQAAFERATADKRPKKAEIKPPEPVKPAEPAKPEPVKEAEPKPAAEKPAEFKLPSFISGDKKEEPKPAEPEIKLDDLPKEAPASATEQEKINWKKTRSLLEKQDSELKALRQKQEEKEAKGKELTQVEATRLKTLEDENKGMREQFQRLGLQQHPRFVQEIIQPLQTTYVEAKRIIKDAGGNPEQLDKALMATGKAHYDVMDEILSEIPESAKGELTSTMRDYRKLAQARAAYLSNAPKALEQLQKQDAVNQRTALESQRGEMEKLFENRVSVMRDNYKFEPLIETKEEEASWWNDIPKNVIATAKKIALDNQDMEVVMDASILAAAAPTLRDLWLKSEQRAQKAEKELAEIKGASPKIGDSPIVPESDESDLTEPFGKVFLKTLRKQKAAS